MSNKEINITISTTNGDPNIQVVSWRYNQVTNGQVVIQGYNSSVLSLWLKTEQLLLYNTREAIIIYATVAQTQPNFKYYLS